jgi:hypothetical protein
MRRGWRPGLAGPVVAGLMAFLGIGEALARGGDKSWEFGAYTVFSRHSNETEIDEGFGFGVRGAYYIRAAHALEVNVDRNSPDAKVEGSEFDVTRTVLSYVRNYSPKGNDKMSPYVQFGLGYLTAEVTGPVPGSAEDGSTLLQAGGGVRYFYGKRVGLRVDGRWSSWRGDSEATPRERFHTFDVTIGVTFLPKGGA